MYIAFTLFTAFLLIFALIEFKTSRPYGDLIKTHPYRRVMWYIMRTANGSVVYWDFDVDIEPALNYVSDSKGTLNATMTHLLVGAVGKSLNDHPDMNRFVSGKRLYQRKGAWVSFTVKRVRMNKESKLAVVKEMIPPDATLKSIIDTINKRVNYSRSGKKTYTDRELNLFEYLPRPVFDVAQRAFRLADYFNLLPKSFIKNDPLYTSIFISNLGSVGVEAGFHHLYEWGNCPIFIMAGKVREVPVQAEDGSTEWRKKMLVRITFDERINDGMSAFNGVETIRKILEDPIKYFGPLPEAEPKEGEAKEGEAKEGEPKEAKQEESTEA